MAAGLWLFLVFPRKVSSGSILIVKADLNYFSVTELIEVDALQNLH